MFPFPKITTQSNKKLKLFLYEEVFSTNPSFYPRISNFPSARVLFIMLATIKISRNIRKNNSSLPYSIFK